jgi:signal transduction histidine kinase
LKLGNHTLKYLLLPFMLIIAAWAGIFYYQMIDEIYDSIDDGLENTRMLIVERAARDSSILLKSEFAEGNYTIREVAAGTYPKDTYHDTMIYMVSEKDYEPVRVLHGFFSLYDKTYELHIISSMVEEDDLKEDLFYSILWLYLALLVSILLINRLLLKNIWQPFYSILEKLNSFRLGTSHLPESVPSRVTEFRALDAAVQDLMAHTTDIYNSQKQFIENAAHELQTPIAISMGKLELMVEKNDLDPSQVQHISHVIQALERMGRLNKSLLLLSKIENRQFIEKQELDIAVITEKISAEFHDFAAFKNVHIQQVNQETSSPVTVNMDLYLAEILISNLLKNAIIHNMEGGEVNIMVRPSKLTISNTSNGHALDPDNIFTRFYHTGHGSGNTGLGLAIVKAICDVYGFSVVYSYDGQQRFEVYFKTRA